MSLGGLTVTSGQPVAFCVVHSATLYQLEGAAHHMSSASAINAAFMLAPAKRGAGLTLSKLIARKF